MSASLVILPFYFFDPTSFTPLTAGNKLAGLDSSVPFASSLIILTTFGLSIVFAGILKKRLESNLLSSFFWMSAAVQFFPMFCGVALTTALKGHLDFSFMHDRYGLMFMFFGLWGCWPYLTSAQHGRAGDSRSASLHASA